MQIITLPFGFNSKVVRGGCTDFLCCHQYLDLFAAVIKCDDENDACVVHCTSFVEVARGSLGENLVVIDLRHAASRCCMVNCHGLFAMAMAHIGGGLTLLPHICTCWVIVKGLPSAPWEMM